MKLFSSKILRLLSLFFLIFSFTGETLAQVDLTQEGYSEIIDRQRWLLIAALLIIVTLGGLFYYISRLNRNLRNNEANQREINQRIIRVVNNTDSLIISLDKKGDIRLVNEPIMNLYKDWLGIELKAGDNILNATRNTPAHNIWYSWISKSKGVSKWREAFNINLNDKEYYYLGNFSAIHRQDGSYAGLVMMGNDITREHEFNVQIAEQHDLLEKSNKAKERMLSILAHDLKDAVYSALSMSQLVVDEPEEFDRDELLRLFSLMHNNFEKTQNLLEGLLTWMKTQTGALEARPITFYLHELVDEVLANCEERSRKKEVELKANLDQDLQVKADREMIKTVIRNLVSNSIKYTHSGKGNIEIRAVSKNDTVTLHVKDNGEGISKEDQNVIMNGPGRLTKPGTNNERGTGFGISLCRELLKLNNSQLKLHSEEGEGADFYFSLPLRPANPKTTE